MRLALTPIVERLRGAGLARVQGVLEMPRAEPPVLPAFFVVPTAETAGANATAGVRDQAVDVGFSVMVAVDGARRNEAGVSEALKAECDRVVDALVGWTHPAASRACDYAGGRLASASGSSVVWEVRLRSRYHLRGTR